MFALLLATRRHLGAIEPCTLCLDGSSVTMPNSMIEIPGYPKLSCSAIDDLIPSLFPDDTAPECTLARQVSSLCGCPILPNSCSLCSDGSAVSRPDVQIEEFTDIFLGNVPSCQWVEAYLRSFDQDHKVCHTSREIISSKCGCMGITEIENSTELQNSSHWNDLRNYSDGVLQSQVNSSNSSSLLDFLRDATYFGAKTDEDVHRLFWCSRSASFISGISCIALMIDCFRNKKRRRNLYHQIMMTMSAFDLLYSISMAFGTLPMDSNDIFDNLGEIGNSVTCKIQGGTLQWGGITSLFLNCSLSTCKPNLFDRSL
jgi:hypothetical protein